MQWYIEKRVLYVALVGDLDVEAVVEVQANMLKRMEEGTPPIHLIRDERRIGKVPSRLPMMDNARKLAQHPALGWVVSIDGNLNAAARFLFNLAIRLMRLRICRVTSLQEAVQFLESVDTSLDFSQISERAIAK